MLARGLHDMATEQGNHIPMTAHTADPRGYYAVLGIDPLADPAAVKAAYRAKALELHPDRNHRDTTDAFQVVAEAYRVLHDPRQRVRYDLLGLTDAESLGLAEYAPLPCRRCGRITAQPRHLVLRQAKSSLLWTKTVLVTGIYCRDCAETATLAASTVSWLLGWWSPLGPLATLRALWHNLKGDLPAAENARVLLYQARAFLARGDIDIARSLAEQARPFAAAARDAGMSEQAAVLLERLPDGGRKLRNRWGRLSAAFLLQSAALSVLASGITVVALAIMLRWVPGSAADTIKLMPVEVGDLRHVAMDALKLREAPSGGAPLVALLDRFEPVRVTEVPDDGDWVRIVSDKGLAGYVPVRFLFGGDTIEAESRWCHEQRGQSPRAGEVLGRRSGGDHGLMVRSTLDEDALVRLKTPAGATLVTFYMTARSEAAVSGIPEGSYRAVFATGSDYSRACGLFLSHMKSYVAAAPMTFRATDRARSGLPHLVLEAPGTAPGKPHPLDIEQFFDPR